MFQIFPKEENINTCNFFSLMADSISSSFLSISSRSKAYYKIIKDIKEMETDHTKILRLLNHQPTLQRANEMVVSQACKKDLKV